MAMIPQLPTGEAQRLVNELLSVLGFVNEWGLGHLAILPNLSSKRIRTTDMCSHAEVR